MPQITIFQTKTTTLRDLLDHFSDLVKGNLDFVVGFLDKQHELKYIANLGSLDWDGDILS